ncbi:TrfB-related DNA-binding protein [Pseudomonas protegens]|uniref:TrfB-related DNA-binding protein n=1 Tax=Pseudomonas protegens TaxID=380021 RepID=UPI0023EAA99C|nr:TrfB-related DNA-binding protein [Pseudomonas protegens]MDF4211098.1 TrfB-related DNA-binding protein [Pseudomonas protegens]
MDTTKKREEQLMELATTIKNDYTPAQIAQLVRLIAPAPVTGEMSAEDFERLMKDLAAKNSRRGYSPKSVEAARLVLVMGANATEAAKETNQTRQSVNQLMMRIRRRMEDLPQAWKHVSAWFPSDVAKQLEDLSVALRAAQAEGAPVDKKTKTFKITHKAQ